MLTSVTLTPVYSATFHYWHYYFFFYILVLSSPVVLCSYIDSEHPLFHPHAVISFSVLLKHTHHIYQSKHIVLIVHLKFFLLSLLWYHFCFPLCSGSSVIIPPYIIHV